MSTTTTTTMTPQGDAAMIFLENCVVPIGLETNNSLVTTEKEHVGRSRQSSPKGYGLYSA
jgi:hypothetical protein